MAFLNELNTFTNKHIVPGVVDNVFKNDPLLAYMKTNEVEIFPGGSVIQENFTYDVLKGGSYAKGSTFDITRRQTNTGASFDPKFYQVNVTEFLEDLEVQIKGEHAVFSLLDADMVNAALTMSAILAIALYNEGQGTGRTNDLNGLAEIINDGSGNSWTGNSHTTYGTLTRSGTVGSALNSVPSQVSGVITYPILEEQYSTAVIGNEEPNLGITTNLGFAYIKEKFQPQQRFQEEDPKIGFRGLRFNNSIIMRSQYAPGTQGVNDADLGNYLDASGETLWFLNTKFFRFWTTDSPEYAFGFSGFKPAQDNSIVAGQYKWSGNVTCQAPRLQKQLYDITG
jgi:hypothetical protein